MAEFRSGSRHPESGALFELGVTWGCVKHELGNQIRSMIGNKKKARDSIQNLEHQNPKKNPAACRGCNHARERSRPKRPCPKRPSPPGAALRARQVRIWVKKRPCPIGAYLGQEATLPDRCVFGSRSVRMESKIPIRCKVIRVLLFESNW